MKDFASLRRLYLANSAVLITHEIDSAYWREWELFHLPGGLDVFLVASLALVVVTFVGYRELLLGRRAGLLFSWLQVACGLFAVAIHATFLLRGSEAFRAPVSLALLGATLPLSLVQAFVTAKAGGAWRRGRGAM